MRGKKSPYLWMDADLFREHRTEEEFKQAFRSGKLPWTEVQRYFEWRKSELKDRQIALRISGTDVMKLKFLARMQGKKYQTYMGEILKQEIHAQEDRMASARSDRERGARAVAAGRLEAAPERPAVGPGRPINYL